MVRGKQVRVIVRGEQAGIMIRGEQFPGELSQCRLIFSMLSILLSP